MTQNGLQLKRAAGSRCWGTGLIAMDIIESDQGEFAAAGGSCGNVMAILAWLGWATTPVARLGDDDAGTFVMNEFKTYRVGTRFMSRESTVQTPIVIQRFVTDKEGRQVHRFSLTCPECGAWLPRHRPITLQQAERLRDSAQHPKAYYFDRVSPGALRLAKIAREKGAIVFFEPASIGDERKFQNAVDICHVLKYSRDRVGHVPDLAMAASPKLVVETQGAAGLRFRWRNRWTQLDAFETDILIDAAGSGDWCTAALVHHIGTRAGMGLKDLRKEELVIALRTGQALAAINCHYFGARGAMLAMSVGQLNRRLRKLALQTYSRPLEIVTASRFGATPPDYCRQCDPTGRDHRRVHQAKSTSGIDRKVNRKISTPVSIVP